MSVKDHFDRRRLLVTGGWFGRLTHNELAMLDVYEVFADRDTNKSRPGGGLIAEAIGHENTNHVSRLRRKLERYELIKIVSHGGRGPLDTAEVEMLMPPQRQAKLFRDSMPPTDGGLNGEVKPPKNESYAPQIERAHNKEDQIIHQINDQINDQGKNLPVDAGILMIVERGETDPSAAIKAMFDGGFIEGWELNSLPPHLDDPEFRFHLAVHFVSLKENGKAPKGIAWRLRIKDLGNMSRADAMDAVLHSTKNNYAGLFKSRKDGTTDEQRKRNHGNRIAENLKL